MAETETSISSGELVELAAVIVRAFVGNNTVPSADLPSVISDVHAALAKLNTPADVAPERPVPPVSIRKSITPDYLISLENGRQYKSLKRHLSSYDLTPEQYREKWGLPSDYPMVAPNYAKLRSEMASAFGLGRTRGPKQTEPKRGGRRKAA
ncbi:MucR family transcriptional regulator [Enterovirga sp. CN4-39]|uniref:MucR family transcriptional regulator n=1 Tax=Enterovirga sp. CN4-39 TaxID=3400910 RepID=UPI003C0FA231